MLIGTILPSVNVGWATGMASGLLQNLLLWHLL